MDKPMILVEQEMKTMLVDIINTYSQVLPITSIHYAFKECTDSLEQVVEQQIVQAQKQYEESEGQEDGDS